MEQKNVYHKYIVLDAQTNEPKKGRYFVLRIDANDPKERDAVRDAMNAYIYRQRANDNWNFANEVEHYIKVD